MADFAHNASEHDLLIGLLWSVIEGNSHVSSWDCQRAHDLVYRIGRLPGVRAGLTTDVIVRIKSTDDMPIPITEEICERLMLMFGKRFDQLRKQGT